MPSAAAPPPDTATATLRARYEAALDEAAFIAVKLEAVSLEEGAEGGEGSVPARALLCTPTPHPAPLPAPPLPTPSPPSPPLITAADLRALGSELRSLALAALSLASDGLAALGALNETLAEVAGGVGELVDAARAARRRGGRRGTAASSASWGVRGGGVATRARTAARRRARGRGW